jgi:hypothetical protein
MPGRPLEVALTAMNQKVGQVMGPGAFVWVGHVSFLAEAICSLATLCEVEERTASLPQPTAPQCCSGQTPPQRVRASSAIQERSNIAVRVPAITGSQNFLAAASHVPGLYSAVGEKLEGPLTPEPRRTTYIDASAMPPHTLGILQPVGFMK